jgi:hypothetical protein
MTQKIQKPKSTKQNELISAISKNGKKLTGTTPLSIMGFEEAAQALAEKGAFHALLGKEVAQLKSLLRKAAYEAHRNAGSPANNKVAIETGKGPAVTIAVASIAADGKGSKTLDAEALEKLPSEAVEHCDCQTTYVLTGPWAEWMEEQLLATYGSKEIPDGVPAGLSKKVEARAKGSIEAYLKTLPIEDAQKVLSTVAVESRVTLPRRK